MLMSHSRRARSASVGRAGSHGSTIKIKSLDGFSSNSQIEQPARGAPTNATGSSCTQSPGR